MKKIKLIAPILGLTTLATSLVPITSCNKDRGMSKAAWNKAFAQIKDPWNTDRNFTVEGYLYKIDETGKEVKDQSWSAKASGKFNEGVQTEGTVVDHYDSCLIDDIIWIKDSKDNISPYLGVASNSGVMIASFVGFGEIFDSMYEYKTYKGNNKYEAIWLNQSNLIGTCDLEFDEQLRIRAVEAKLYYGEEVKQANLVLGAKLGFSQYGSTTVTIQESQFPVADRVKKAKLATTGDKFVIDSFTPDTTNTFIYKFEMPSDLSISGLNTININNNTFEECIVLLNDEELVEDEDYQIVGENKIVLNNPLNKNDKLWIAMVFNTAVATTMELVKQ